MASSTPAPPIVYTIAGSDSGGGAGIQADLHTFHSLGCHGCSVTTCLTAQNSVGVTSVFTPPVEFLRSQWDALVEDMKPMGIKVGMLGSKVLVGEVATFLSGLRREDQGETTGEGDIEGEAVFIVLDPVMIATSGAKLIEDEAKEAIIEQLFPLVDIITPNKYEAEELLGRKLNTPDDIKQGAKDILSMGVKAVLIKGGYTLLNDDDDTEPTNDRTINHSSNDSDDVNLVVGHAQDYFLSCAFYSDNDNAEGGGRGERICDGGKGIWLRSPLYKSEHTHGTGCTLSSAIAAAGAIGIQQRQISAGFSDGYVCVKGGALSGGGATSAIRTVDACCIAKEYVTAGVARAVRLGRGPGPVVHTSFASSHRYFPSIPTDPSIPEKRLLPFQPIRLDKSVAANPKGCGDGAEARDDMLPILGKILPVVDDVELVKRLCQTDGITDIQLRLKLSKDTNTDANMDNEIGTIIEQCQTLCSKANVRLWINDHYQQAIRHRCFGVHLGQEDLARCIQDCDPSTTRSGLDAIRNAGLALGVSTHSYAELSVAIGLAPSYISLGPIYPTNSKKVEFNPQGVEMIRTWRKLLGNDRDSEVVVGRHTVPLVVIGGISDAWRAGEAWKAGADCVAVIGAVTGEEARDNLEGIMRDFTAAMK